MPDLWYDVDTALAEVPVNLIPLVDDTDFKAIEGSVAYNAAGLALYWHFCTTGGAYSVTAVTPTTGGDYDWTDQGDAGIYTIEIPASGGASINNDTEGFGWFTGVATGVLPWRGPTIGFRAAGLNNALIDSAWSATRGLTGTAVPDAAADAAGGLPISDAGGLDLDTYIKRLEAAWTAALAARIDENISAAKTLTADYDAAKTAAAAGAAMTLTAAYDAAKAAAPAGAKMDLVDAPNATAVTAIQAGLATAAKLLAYVKSILRKDQAADADIAGTYDAATDSLQAIRDTEPMGTAMRGTDGANTTTPPSAADIKTAMEGVGSHLTLIKAETDKLATAMEADGAVHRFTENALEQAPTGSGSGASLEDIEASTVLAKEATVAGVDAKVSALGASVVTVTSPVSVDASTVTLVCGDDYYDADGRALTFTDSGGTYPSFTGGSCKFTVRDLAKGTDTETAGTIVDANTVRFELTKTATGAWTAGGKYRFDVEVTLASGHEVTVATGAVVMLAKYSG